MKDASFKSNELYIPLKYSCFVCGILISHIMQTDTTHALWLNAILLAVGGGVFGFLVFIAVATIGSFDLNLRVKTLKNVPLTYFIVFALVFFALNSKEIMSFLM